MASSDKKGRLKMAASTNLKSTSKTANCTVIVKNVKVANSESKTSSSMSRTVSHVNKNSIVKTQLSSTKTKKPEPQMSGNKVNTRANPSTKVNDSSKSNDGLQPTTTVKSEEKMPASESSEAPKTVNSIACNDKSVKCSRTSRVWNRNVPAQPKAKEIKPKLDKPVIAPQMESLAVQTNETEILNPLIVDDAKILTPSKLIVLQVEKNREELRKKQLLNVKRKFSKHLARQEEHLDNLSEFLEKAYVTRKPRPIANDNLEEDKRLITSMDQLMKRHVPKAEPLNNVTERIKRKEQELLGLLDTCW